eukprot:jgi/Tetstr1/439715/TSEL_028134.t1
MDPPSLELKGRASAPSAGAGPSDAPSRVFAAEPQPASTGAPAVAKTPSAGAGLSDAPPRVFAAEPQPASTGAPAVAKLAICSDDDDDSQQLNHLPDDCARRHRHETCKPRGSESLERRFDELQGCWG